ncbi:hypothetical protein ACOMHN_036701 [Nucella lapillus]
MSAETPTQNGSDIQTRIAPCMMQWTRTVLTIVFSLLTNADMQTQVSPAAFIAPDTNAQLHIKRANKIKSASKQASIIRQGKGAWEHHSTRQGSIIQQGKGGSRDVGTTPILTHSSPRPHNYMGIQLYRSSVDIALNRAYGTPPVSKGVSPRSRSPHRAYGTPPVSKGLSPRSRSPHLTYGTPPVSKGLHVTAATNSQAGVVV